MAREDNYNQPHSWRQKILSFPRILGFSFGEGPLYYVLEKKGTKEIRDYKSFIIAQTVVRHASYEDAVTLGFWKLFDYFSFNNLGARPLGYDYISSGRSTRMDVTSPIFEMKEDDGWRIALMTPSRFSFATVPLPVDPDVQLSEVSESIVAVNKTQGLVSPLKMSEETLELEQWICAHKKFRIASAPYVAHHDLFPTFQFLRKTEVHIKVENDEV